MSYPGVKDRPPAEAGFNCAVLSFVTDFANLRSPNRLPEAEGAIRERIGEALASQRWPTTTVLSGLLAAQDALGYLPDEAREMVAE